MTTFIPPNCPKCGGDSTAPARMGMSNTPYRCTRCEHRFGLVIPTSMEGVPFHFSAHTAEVGHSCVVGPAGAGMTVGSEVIQRAGGLR